MSTALRDQRASAHLDTFRALAALAVLLGHTRSLFFRSYYDLASPGKPTLALYFVSSFAHEAVIVFFVLSGFFITSSVLRAIRSEKWSWRGYLVTRLSRLYIVLIPGLLLTLFWDQAGMVLFGEKSMFSGSPEYSITDLEQMSDQTSPGVLLGNLAFLQTVAVPCLGSNSPLWSLSNEFWYYILIPLVCLGFHPGARWWPRFVNLALCVALGLVLPPRMMLYFAIFLMGAGVALVRHRSSRPASPPGRFALGGMTVAFLAFLCAVRLLLADRMPVVADFLIGLSFAGLVMVLLRDTVAAGGLYNRVAVAGAGFSYTLYLVHLPLMVFFRNGLIGDRRWEPDAAGLGCGAAIVLGVIVYAYLISLLTEARTDFVRVALQSWLDRISSAVERKYPYGERA